MASNEILLTFFTFFIIIVSALLVTVESQNDSDIATTQAPTAPPLETKFEKNTDIGICTCDLTSGGCDVNCCCDNDCSDADRNAFSACDDNVPETDSQMCINHLLLFRDNSPYIKNITLPGLFCLKVDNYKERNYYEAADAVRTLKEFDDYQKKYGASSYKLQSTSATVVRRSYKSGDPIVTLFKNDVEGTLALPAQLSSQECVDSNPAGYLYSRSSTCVRRLLTSDLHPAFQPTSYYQGFKILANPEFLDGSQRNVTNATETNSAPAPANGSRVYDGDAALVVEPATAQTCVDASGVSQACRLDAATPARCDMDASTGRQLCQRLVSEVEYVLEYEVPGTLSKATVKFVLSDFYVNSDAIFQTFRVTFLKAGSAANVARRSGNPGYLVGLPVMAGVIEKTVLRKDDVDTEVMTIRLNADRSNWLTALGSWLTGDCQDRGVARIPITFGEHIRSACSFGVTFASLSDSCDLLQAMTLGVLVGDNHPTHVATFGNSRVEKVGDWVKILGRDVVHPKVAASEGVCKNVPVGLHYEIVYANVGALGNPQAKIIGVMMQFQYDDIHFLCTGAYCQPGNGQLLQPFEVVNSVGFIDASSTAVGVTAEMPRAPIRLPEDFFYPFS